MVITPQINAKMAKAKQTNSFAVIGVPSLWLCMAFSFSKGGVWLSLRSHGELNSVFLDENQVSWPIDDGSNTFQISISLS